jgi:sugar (pentulose or hexulose) kinase
MRKKILTLAIDIGASFVKVVVLNEAGRFVAIAPPVAYTDRNESTGAARMSWTTWPQSFPNSTGRLLFFPE